MSIKFFGQYLLEHGKIIKEELLDAIEFQKKVNAKLGTIALDAGYLTAQQVEHIHNEQQRTDKLFGELAIGLNYLTSEQLEELLIIQRNERVSLGDALVQKGYLTLSELETELYKYKQYQEQFSQKAQYAIVKSPNPELVDAFVGLTIRFLLRLTEIEVDVISSHTNPQKIAPHIWSFYQQFSGDSSGIYVISVPEKTLLKIASGIAQDTIYEIDDFTKDAVKEFVNTLVGNTLAKLSHLGIKLNLKPPEVATSLNMIKIPTDSANVVSVTLSSPQYEVQMSVLYSSLVPKSSDKKK